MLPIAGGGVNCSCELSSHQNNHFWDCDDEDKIVCSLFPSMKLPLCQMQLCEAFKINFLVYEMTHSLIS